MEKSNTSNTETEKKEANLLNIMHELLEKIIHDIVESHIRYWDGIKDFNIIKKETAKDLANIKLTSRYLSGIIEYKYLKDNESFNELVIDSIIKTIDDEQLQNKILNYEQKRQEKTDRLIELLNRNLYDIIRDLDFSQILDQGYWPKVMQLIYDGANINAQDKYGLTALMYAAFNENENKVKPLIAVGANINIQANDGSTALILATIRDDVDTVELLIAAGANIDIQDNYGKTALMYAIEKGHKDIVKLLSR